jgi:hypothetical protein
MPRLNGIQVVEQLRSFFLKLNEELLDLNVEFLEPRYVFLTAFLTKAFRAHLAKL